MAGIKDLARLSDMAYENRVNESYRNFSLKSSVFDPDTGFAANAHYNSVTEEVVISYAGTTKEDWRDLYADLNLGAGDIPTQARQGVDFASNVLQYLEDENLPVGEITYTGHSLGGFIAQHAHIENRNGVATVFNSPGYGGVIFGSEMIKGSISYIYSNPSEWGALGIVHRTGDILSENVLFVMDAKGHSLDSIIVALDSGAVPLSADQWGAILAEGLRNGDLTVNDVLPFVGTNDIVRDTVLQAMRDSGTECFAAGTPIDMWPRDPSLQPGPNGIYNDATVRAGIWQKPIELIAPDDLVVSFDGNGNLVPGVVSRTFRNAAKILLNFHGTKVTPGHVYYRPDSSKRHKFEVLIDILRDDGVIEARDGTQIRAATNVPVGDPRDGFVWAVAGARRADGGIVEKERGRIRLGTQFIVEGRRSYCVADLIEAGGGIVGEDEMVRVGEDGDPVPFLWEFSDRLPKPEDYVLECSGTTLEDIYKAAEWEGQRPQMPAPLMRDGGPVQPLSKAELSMMAPNAPMALEESADRPSDVPGLKANRKQRRRLAGKVSKSGGMSPRKLN